ncbi:cell cycle checkpoint protein rad1 [Anaeramoeba flamelloides]|uniref:Cell cycle checkpoint protein rad1 n=1 Tax=Anaeramoeba flamelloides TaxID=1746091 RepID=A0ABQ8Z132_9EUKA|nr:cell cycle checkpoint protein rad1 [Anaeramoeba flamelloides]
MTDQSNQQTEEEINVELLEQKENQYNQQEFENNEEDEFRPVFEARVRDISLLEYNLAPICLKKDQMTKVLISSNGLYFHVEGDSKNIQATTFIDASLFEKYEYNLNQKPNNDEKKKDNVKKKINQEKVTKEDKDKEKEKEKEEEEEMETNNKDSERVTMLRLNLSVLLDCLGIFKEKNKNNNFNETVGQIIYPNDQGAFEIDLEDKGVVTWCAIAVNSIDDNYIQPQDEMKFDSTTVTNTIVIDSLGLKTALSELDWGCRTIDMFMFKKPPMLSMQSNGQNGVCRVDCPLDSEAVERLDSLQDQSDLYLSSLLRGCVNALQYSSKASIRMNLEGMLSIQLMIKNRGNIQSFVEFLINPENNEEEEEEEEECEDEEGYYEENESQKEKEKQYRNEEFFDEQLIQDDQLEEDFI